MICGLMAFTISKYFLHSKIKWAALFSLEPIDIHLTITDVYISTPIRSLLDQFFFVFTSYIIANFK